VVGNPGFESDLPAPWTLVGESAVRDDLVPHGGAKCLYLYALFSQFGAGEPLVQNSRTYQRAIAATPGVPMQIFFWVNPDGAGNRTRLRCEIDTYGRHSFTSLVFIRSKAELQPGWSYQQTAAFIPQANSVSVQFDVPQDWGPINGSGFFLVDDVSDTFEPETSEGLRKRLVFNALRSVLLGITGPGAGYASNLGGRVYPVLILPDAENAVQTPYVCMVDVGSGVYGDKNATLYERIWTMRVFGFVREGSSDRMSSDVASRLADLEDDLVKAVMQNEHMQQTVQLARIVNQETSAGLGSGDDYGEVMMTLELTQWIAPDSLAP